MRKIILLLSIAVVLFVSCENPFWSNPPSKTPPIQDTVIEDPPFEYTYDEDAEIMAVWYYEVLEAPDSIAQRIYDEMSLIDELYKDSIDYWSQYVMGSLHPDYAVKRLKFIPPWKMSQIRFKFVASLYDSIYNSIVDSSNTLFYDSLKTLQHDSLTFDGPLYYDAYLYLTGIQNSLNAARVFKQNRAIEWIDLPAHYGIGDYSNIYPWFEDSVPKYFYAFKWGDCPAGCINWHLFYFEIRDSNAVLVDIYDSELNQNDTLLWFDDLIASMQKLRYKWWEELND